MAHFSAMMQFVHHIITLMANEMIINCTWTLSHIPGGLNLDATSSTASNGKKLGSNLKVRE
jgi:hypothetical protein